jgi:hypothetical protein
MRQQLRIARPVTDLAHAADMYCHGLAPRVLASFRDHNGFDGIISSSFIIPPSRNGVLRVKGWTPPDSRWLDLSTHTGMRVVAAKQMLMGIAW